MHSLDLPSPTSHYATGALRFDARPGRLTRTVVIWKLDFATLPEAHEFATMKLQPELTALIVKPMPPRILKRDEVAQKLREWQSGHLSSEDLLQWADRHYPSDDLDYEDWEGDDSVTNEVLTALAMLDMNLSLPEDAGIYLDLLSTPAGQFQKGYARYKESLETIDYPGRCPTLKNVPLYAAYL